MADEEMTPYGRRVGERLRAIRRQKRLSLQEVESESEQEFKASVLGAYERGERAISVPRLQRLAHFYNVPVGQLLPPAGLHNEGLDPPHPPPARLHEPTVIDLTPLETPAPPPTSMLAPCPPRIPVPPPGSP